MKRLEGLVEDSAAELDQDALVQEVTSLSELVDAAEAENGELRAKISASAATLSAEKAETAKWRARHGQVREEQTRLGMKLQAAESVGAANAALCANKQQQVDAASVRPPGAGVSIRRPQLRFVFFFARLVLHCVLSPHPLASFTPAPPTPPPCRRNSRLAWQSSAK